MQKPKGGRERRGERGGRGGIGGGGGGGGTWNASIDSRKVEATPEKLRW